MGLTNSSVGKNVVEEKPDICDKSQYIVALAGNPNVGKSTVFNALTGMNQHTGNWSGKTVANAWGECRADGVTFAIVDIPGTYSLDFASPEEKIASDFICKGKADAVIVVCDATCLERNLALVLQVSEVTDNMIVCVNLMDEARRKHISVNTEKLSKIIGAPVISTSAGNKEGLDRLKETVTLALKRGENKYNCLEYPEYIEQKIKRLETALVNVCGIKKGARRHAVSILRGEDSNFLKYRQVKNVFDSVGAFSDEEAQIITCAVITRSEEIYRDCVSVGKAGECLDTKIDKIVTGRVLAYPVMLALLGIVFWLTISGANYPSEILSDLSFKFENFISVFLCNINCPTLLHDMLVFGVIRVLCWVISVMLPPMAIFFPLFTLLEDLGFLPRIAYNLDRPFCKCNTCGKQALTMCMGFGCNAAGVVGTRIIESRRERLIAVITNSFVPCNGKFPTLIALISMFFVTAKGVVGTIGAAAVLTFAVVLSVVVTLAASKLLSETVLKGEKSAFALELPPYRKPDIVKVIVRSVADRSAFVLARAAAVAAPAGLVIWILANINVCDVSLLGYICNFLDPLGKALGMDGVILAAFVLGFPANEIVVPVILMSYLSEGTPVRIENVFELKDILVNNGWTFTTAICVTVFMLFHAPCSTTLLTVKKETGSLKWTALAFAVPLLIGMTLCFIISIISKII